MATQTFSPMLGRRMRVTQLDDCGRIIATSKRIVSDGFITVGLSADVEEGTEILKRNAAGVICVNEKSSDSFKRFNLDLSFCGVNPSLLSMVTNAKEYESAAKDIVGITVAEGEMTGKFALEVWIGLAGKKCGNGTETAGVYLLLPMVQSGTLADFEVTGEDSIDFGIANSFTVGGNSWGKGPYKIATNAATPPVAAELPTALKALDHLLLMQTGVAAPPVAEQPVLVSAP